MEHSGTFWNILHIYIHSGQTDRQTLGLVELLKIFYIKEATQAEAAAAPAVGLQPPSTGDPAASTNDKNDGGDYDVIFDAQVGEVNQEPVPEVLGRSVPAVHELQHQPQRVQSGCALASSDYQEEELHVSLQCGGWYVVGC